jgi:Protein of unknown function (DUF2523).
MSWAAFIGAGVAVWAKKVLISLGIGVVSYAGLTILKGQLEAYIFSAIAGIPADAYSIFAMAGMIDAINIWLSAFTVIVTMMAGKKLGML